MLQIITFGNIKQTTKTTQTLIKTWKKISLVLSLVRGVDAVHVDKVTGIAVSFARLPKTTCTLMLCMIQPDEQMNSFTSKQTYTKQNPDHSFCEDSLFCSAANLNLMYS